MFFSSARVLQNGVKPPHSTTLTRPGKLCDLLQDSRMRLNLAFATALYLVADSKTRDSFAVMASAV